MITKLKRNIKEVFLLQKRKKNESGIEKGMQKGIHKGTEQMAALI